jgi:hypothetical protein
MSTPVLVVHDAVPHPHGDAFDRGQHQREISVLGMSLIDAVGFHQGGLAVASAVRADSKENGAIFQAIAAQREAAYGNAAKARQSAARTLRLAPASQGAESQAALAFAMAGDATRAESLAQDLNKRFLLDTQM